MKVGNIVQSNQKGQIVIPKKVRDQLGIGVNSFLNLILEGRGIYLYPIEEVVIGNEGDSVSSYLQVLKKTKGSWVKSGWQKTRKTRKKLELASSLKRKRSW